MRSVILLVAALTLPLTEAGDPFPVRDLILFLTLCVILATLVVQGLSLPHGWRSLMVKAGCARTQSSACAASTTTAAAASPHASTATRIGSRSALPTTSGY
jgi:monovalent cation/hydrogen antiporter